MSMVRPPRSVRGGRTSNATGISGSDYAERARRLIELTNDLKALGANHLLDIPRVVFIGNQSAGKSSVVEGVTGTKVPRDSGTCTRCPMECTMTKNSGPWKCTIKLRLEFEADGSERLNPLTIVFADFSEPNDVELWLKRAQAAILLPGVLDETQAQLFRIKTADEIRTLQNTAGALLSFSFNAVELCVYDPDGVDLAFVDLPGIIQHHSTDGTMVELVQKLVKRAIRGLNTLIVLTIPMTDDVENQQAFVLAKEADPEGKRTIGVGTKPDMLQAGNIGLISTWRDILNGDAHTLQHGYYCVKLPDDATRAANHTRAELQQQEHTFFSSTEPWKQFTDRGRFGIRNFVKSTSKLLINLIETNLPILKEEVNQLLAKDTADYDKLPVLVNTEQPLHIVLSRISAFCRTLEKTVHGEANKSFTHRNRALYSMFRDQITITAPTFDPPPSPRLYATVPTVPSTAPITLKDVRTAIDENLTWELPSYIPFEATKFFILRHVCQWKAPMITCFTEVSGNLTKLVDQLLDEPEHFGRFAELKALVRAIVAQLETVCCEETSTMLNKLFNLENSLPLFTQNSAAFNDARRAWYTDRNISINEVERDEHKVMADIHAYFQIASKRFIDQVPLSIEGELHQAMADRLEAKLFQIVVDLDSDNLSQMLREDPEVMARREFLQQRIARLTAIKQRLLDYERSALMPHLESEVLS